VSVPDVLVIGSGISGAMMARGLLDSGATVAMIDPGADSNLRDRVPDVPFEVLRRTDPHQRSYLIGDNFEGIPAPGVKVGAQLTPPRQFIQKGADELLPSESKTFFPLLPVGIGGLGAGWGAACFTFEDEELRRMGLDPDELVPFYQRAAKLAGISADPESEINARLWRDVPCHQPPLDIDDNAQRILNRHRNNPAALGDRGMTLGRIPMAILSRDLPDQRRANPYFDTDFYGDVRKSIYRPAYMIQELRKRPEFTYLGRRLAIRFDDCGGEVTVTARNLESNAIERHSARRMVLCAGALNSARLALHSLGLKGVKTPILCNPYTYMPTVNLSMLGRDARDRRYSMAQLGGSLETAGAKDIYGCFQMYSYRSLLLFKLVKEMPLPPSLGLTVARVLQNSIAIFGIFFADEQQDSKFLSVRDAGGAPDGMPVAQFEYRQTSSEIQKRAHHESIFASGLRALRAIPIGKIDPGNAGSIHYAGTIPLENPFDQRFHANPDSRLEGAPNVYLGDGAPWNFLPAKGLSFTLMANALRIADRVRKAS
jgi:hypothetical protein